MRASAAPLVVPEPFGSDWQALVDSIPDPIFVKDIEHRWIAVNRAFCELLGRPREDILGRSDFDYSPADEAAVYWAKDDEVLASGIPSVNVEIHTAGGRRRVIETKKALLRRENGSVYLLGIIRDQTDLTRARDELKLSNRELERIVEERTQELRSTNARLRHLAFIDALTGLPNRRGLLERLERRLEQGPVGLLFVDVDHFKWINDSKGHPFGDALLTALALRYRELAGVELVARLGGDEFMLLTAPEVSTSLHSLGAIARSIQEATRATLVVDRVEITLSASIGIASAPDDGLTATDLIRAADAAMYRAKDQGRDRYAFFDPQLGTRAQEFLSVENGLRAALRQGRVRVAFQPIYAARARRRVGVEALARWTDSRLGEVSPVRFIPVAETTGLIHELGHYVLRRSLQLAQERLPAQERLAINLSPRQIEESSFVDRVLATIREHAFSPARLEFEITESIAANPSERVLATLSTLREIGVTIALDDFGTGYSALTQLQRLPVDRVKIDRSFIAEIPGNPKASVLVEAMTRMCDALDLSVVAEGVETEAQLAFLQALGCAEVQGFLLGRPEE
ncbi:MAG: EAL domain-containing protein [Lysobacterales bacterium]